MSAPALRPLALRIRWRSGVPLRQQVKAALAAHGEPLRWAITAVEADVLRLEAVVLVPTGAP